LCGIGVKTVKEAAITEDRERVLTDGDILAGHVVDGLGQEAERLAGGHAVHTFPEMKSRKRS
jgi:glycerol dehydrogenase-like iron-containing ADH family enzyme